MDIPPVSKVIPLPTRPSTREELSGSPRYSRTISFGGWSLPLATPRKAPMPSSSMCFRSRTLMLRPSSSATCVAISAIRVGVRTLAGSLTMSLARMAASAIRRPR